MTKNNNNCETTNDSGIAYRDIDYGRHYARFSVKALAMAMKIAKNPETARDLVQGVYVKILEYAAKHPEEQIGNLDALVFWMLKKRAIDQAKRSSYAAKRSAVGSDQFAARAMGQISRPDDAVIGDNGVAAMTALADREVVRAFLEKVIEKARVDASERQFVAWEQHELFDREFADIEAENCWPRNTASTAARQLQSKLEDAAREMFLC